MTFSITFQIIDVYSWITLYNLEKFEIAKAEFWFRLLVACFSLQRNVFDPSRVHVRFVVHDVDLGQVIPFPLSGSFHQFSILIFIYMLLLQKEIGAKTDIFPKSKTV